MAPQKPGDSKFFGCFFLKREVLACDLQRGVDVVRVDPEDLVAEEHFGFAEDVAAVLGHGGAEAGLQEPRMREGAAQGQHGGAGRGEHGVVEGGAVFAGGFRRG